MNDDGEIDGTVLEQEPGRAIVRRHWANEADKIGYLVRTPSGVAIRYESDQNVAPGLFPIGCTSIKVGQQVVLTDLDGRELPFRVANLF